VEELPYFDMLQNRAKADKLRIMLVSLDFKSQWASKVIPFIRKNNLQSDVLLLDETDANSYIDKVSKDWSGAIPATLIVNSSKNIRQFFEKKFDSFEQLDSIVVKLNERN
jgi:peroxiredoxin